MASLPVIDAIFNTILKRGEIRMRIMKRANLRRDFGCPVSHVKHGLEHSLIK